MVVNTENSDVFFKLIKQKDIINLKSALIMINALLDTQLKGGKDIRDIMQAI